MCEERIFVQCKSCGQIYEQPPTGRLALGPCGRCGGLFYRFPPQEISADEMYRADPRSPAWPPRWRRG